MLSLAIVLSLCTLLVSYLLWSKAKKTLIVHFDKVKVLVIAPNQQAQVQLLFDSCLKALKYKHNLFKLQLLNHHEEEHYRQQRLHHQDQEVSCTEESRLDACSLSTQDQISLYQADPHSLDFQPASSCLVQAVFEDCEYGRTELTLEFIQDLPFLENADFELALSTYFETVSSPLYVICSALSPALIDQAIMVERNALNLESKLNAYTDSDLDPYGHQSLLILGQSNEINETIFSSIRKHIVRNFQKRARGKKLISQARASFLITIFLLVMSLFFFNAHLTLSRIPLFSQVDQWSVDSLIHTEQALLKVRKESLSLRPDKLVLKLARPSLEKRLKQFDQTIVGYLEQYIERQMKTLESQLENPQPADLTLSAEILTPHNPNEEVRFLSLIQRVVDREKSRLDYTTTHEPFMQGANGLKQKSQKHEDLQLLKKIYDHLQQSFRFSLMITHSEQLGNIYDTLKKLESFKQLSLDAKIHQNINLNSSMIRSKNVLSKLADQAYLKALNHSQAQSFVGLMTWRNFVCQQQPYFSQFPQVFSHLEQEYQQQLLMLWQSTFSTDQNRTQLTLQFNDLKFKTTDLSALVFEVVKTLKSLKMIKEVLTKASSNADCLLKSWSLKLQQKWHVKLKHKVDTLKNLLIESLKSPKSLDNALYEESLYKESQQLFTWALGHFENHESLELMIELYQKQWVHKINLALQASSDLNLIQAINKVKQQIKVIEVKLKKARFDQAKQEVNSDHQLTQVTLFIKAWQRYIQKTTQWLTPHQILMNYDEITCLETALNSHGESKWNLLLGDSLEYYFTFDIGQQSFLSNGTSKNLKFWWKPWSAISIRIFEQDGEIDRLSTENNDHQIGLTRKVIWSSLSHVNTIHLPDQYLSQSQEYLPKTLSMQKAKHLLPSPSVQDTQKQTFKLFLNDQHSCWTQVFFQEL